MVTEIEQTSVLNIFKKQIFYNLLYENSDSKAFLDLGQRKIVLPKIKSPLRYPGVNQKP